MNNRARILVAHHKGVAWLRVEGRGSVHNSCELKAYAESRLRSGDEMILVDLEDCQYMDSTFMGTLTGLACRLEGDNRSRATLEIVSPSERARDLLENLGLDQILLFHTDGDSVNGMDWATLQETMTELFPEVFENKERMKQHKAERVLDAHEALAATSSENDARFNGVICEVAKELQKAHS